VTFQQALKKGASTDDARKLMTTLLRIVPAPEVRALTGSPAGGLSRSYQDLFKPRGR
jgi:hypothetical protein